MAGPGEVVAAYFARCLLADLGILVSALEPGNQETEELKIDLLITDYS
jgi:hypothetical protein